MQLLQTDLRIPPVPPNLVARPTLLRQLSVGSEITATFPGLPVLHSGDGACGEPRSNLALKASQILDAPSCKHQQPGIFSQTGMDF